ncbi:MSMEG_0565 family glycosyltransferase [Caballeronia sp. LZ062]|uniref:MSMEG_0565 family glycosyltransferase n=1 Tax=unclassified Caballeronia TaxID=2646786 RepID=UPI002864891B|nr:MULTISPECIES: MSMEG_0565 family glycosyltransferase [unclassified Caballeronia]MDR5857766.1 MSMEG_0565 family glycosyltransferase [Caballeronia sp. LZ050]MDR5869316.1 MSMEG_0565 family glycosyltransferase [Caballeronia sp. LZ062]
MCAMKALRIALLTHSVNPRGGVVHTLELAHALHDSGHEVTVFAPARENEVMFRTTPFPVVLARVEGKRDMAQMVDERIRALKAALAGQVFDVHHAQDSISGNALAELKEEGGVRGFIRTVHHLDRFDDSRLSHWQDRAWRDADEVLCVSDTWTRIMRETYRIDARTVSNGIDVSRYRAPVDCGAVRERFGISGRGPVVLAVGGIEERKNTSMLLEAFALLRAANPSAQLVLAGGASLLDHDTYARRFFARAAQLNLPSSASGTPIVITGALEDAAMPALFRIADVVTMISLREGFGLVALEALASRRPVVVSEIAPFTEYLDDRTCVFANPQDPHDIARALTDTGGIDFDHAVPALLERYTWQASAHRHLDIYRQWLADALLTHD